MKISIYQDKIEHYRIPFWNLMKDRVVYKIVLYEKINNDSIGSLSVHVRNLFGFRYFSKLDFKSDRIVLPFDLHLLNLYFLVFSKHRSKVVLWGIGISKNRFLNIVRFFLIRFFNSVIVYEDVVANYWKSLNLSNVFYKGNTVLVNKIDFHERNYNYFLICGSLDKRKKIDLFLDIAVKHRLNVRIVGDGPEFFYLSNKYSSNNIVFLGKIIDKNNLTQLFKDSIAVVHPGQAGLTVLESFGYGVPFVTLKNSISGGEKFNIIDGYNGFFVNDITDLESKVLSLLDVQFCELLSRNAYYYYWKNRTLDLMVTRFLNGLCL